MSSLSLNSNLNTAAMGYAKFIAGVGIPGGIQHYADGRSPDARAKAAGYGSCVGEVVAGGFGSAETVFQAWLDSPGHKAVMEDRRGFEVGVAEYNYYWVMMIGIPKSQAAC